MGRPAKLTPDQLTEIERRLAAGESASALGREFGVSETALRKRFQNKFEISSKVREVAEKLADSRQALELLSPLHRSVAIDLSEKLRNISRSVAAAAELGAKTGHRLHALANAEVSKVDDGTPLSEDSLVALRGVGVLTKLANESLSPALNLLAANRDRLKDEDDRTHAGVVVMSESELVRIASATNGN